MDTNNLQVKPSWFNVDSIDETMDAREMLKSGQHPLAEVIKRTTDMQTGKIFELITPFTPMPLIEKVSANGFLVYVQQISDAEVHTFFIKSKPL
jgi:hypothetical protein